MGRNRHDVERDQSAFKAGFVGDFHFFRKDGFAYKHFSVHWVLLVLVLYFSILWVYLKKILSVIYCS